MAFSIGLLEPFMPSPLILKLTTDLSETYLRLIRQAKELAQVCAERKIRTSNHYRYKETRRYYADPYKMPK